MPRSDFNRLTLGTRLASDLGRARQKIRIRIVRRIGLRQTMTEVPLVSLNSMINGKSKVSEELNLRQVI